MPSKRRRSTQASNRWPSVTTGTKSATDPPPVLDRILGKDREESELRQTAATIAAEFVKSIATTLADVLPSVPAFSLQKLDVDSSTKDPPEAGEGSVAVLLWEKEDAPRCGLLFDGLALAILTNALLGADPEDAVDASVRPASEFELELISMIAAQLGRSLSEALKLPRAMGVAETLHGAEFSDHQAAAQTFVSLSLAIGTEPSLGSLQILIPVQFVKNAIEVPASAKSGNAIEWNARYKRSVMRVRLPLTVTIDLPSTSLGAIENWACGDVIEFAEPGQGTADVFVGQQRLFEGELGRIGESYSVRLTAAAKTKGEGR